MNNPHMILRILLVGTSPKLPPSCETPFILETPDGLLRVLKEEYPGGAESFSLADWRGLSDWFYHHLAQSFCILLTLDIKTVADNQEAQRCLINNGHVTWIADLSLCDYLKLRDDKWVKLWTPVFYKLRDDYGNKNNDWAGTHPEMQTFLLEARRTPSFREALTPKAYHDYRQLLNCVVDSLHQKAHPTALDRIWAELDAKQQRSGIELIQHPTRDLPAGCLLEQMGFCRKQEGRWVWFSPLFAAYAYFHYTLSGTLRRFLRRPNFVGIGQVVAVSLSTLRGSGRVRMLGVSMIGVLGALFALSGHPWLTLVLCGLALLFAWWGLGPRPSVSSSSPGDHLKSWGLYLAKRMPYLIPCLVISLGSLALYASDSGGFVTLITSDGSVKADLYYPHWISPGDEATITIELTCIKDECPPQTRFSVESVYPQIEFVYNKLRLWKGQASDLVEFGDDKNYEVHQSFTMHWVPFSQPAAGFPKRPYATLPDIGHPSSPAWLPLKVEIQVDRPGLVDSGSASEEIWIDVIPRSIPFIGSLIDDREPVGHWQVRKRLGGVIDIVNSLASGKELTTAR